MTSQTLERGIDCLFALASSDAPLSVPELAKTLSLPESTVYRLLRPLERRGLVERTDQGGRVIGLRVLELCKGLRGSRGYHIAQIARPIMEELAGLTQETIILTVVLGFEAICIESIDSPQPVRLSFEEGQIQPIYAGASAKILLAHAERGFQEEVLSRCEGIHYAHGGAIGCEELRRELDHIREDGFAVTTEEVDPGATAVAAPVLDSNNQLVAGLSVAGPKDRFGEERLPELIELVVASAQRISERYALLS